MNKAKLVELADEVLTDIDIDMKTVLRKELEKQLCEKLSWRFRRAIAHLEATHSDIRAKEYYSVKPILNECIDKLLGEKK